MGTNRYHQLWSLRWPPPGCGGHRQAEVTIELWYSPHASGCGLEVATARLRVCRAVVATGIVVANTRLKQPRSCGDHQAPAVTSPWRLAAPARRRRKSGSARPRPCSWHNAALLLSTWPLKMSSLPALFPVKKAQNSQMFVGFFHTRNAGLMCPEQL